jgi:acetyltransferase-like isoleucine patch superfamily enzyme
MSDLRDHRPVALTARPDLAFGLVLGEGVEVPPSASIGVNVVIHAGSEIGDGVVIQDGAVIGKNPVLGPRSSASRTEPPPTRLADGAAVLTGAVIFAGARLERGAIAGDQCHLRERSVIGPESVIGRGSAIDSDVVVGEGVRIQSNCYLTGNTVVEDHVFVGPGVTTTNDNTMARQPLDGPLLAPRLERACRVGGGVVLCPGVRIGAEAYVAAGSVVVNDVPPGTVVMGVPARQARAVPESDLIEHWL